ncbi:MAG: transporter [Candidatus Korobacteraceae bacterium]
MRPFFKLGLLAVTALGCMRLLSAQDLAPRAYVITPNHSNAVTLTYSFYDGGLNFNGAIPVTGATGTYSVPVFSYYHAFNFFGRSANVTGSLPYAVGNFSGKLLGVNKSLYRSGLLDFSARLSVNLKGGPAMSGKEFSKWKQKMLLGASLKIIAPTGQYDPTKLINWGINRWAFKPELGYSQRFGNWVVDGYGGVWFYTTNDAYYSIPVPKPQTEEPIGSFEGHLSYDLSRVARKKALYPWVSLDGNFWFGGVTSLNGIRNLATKQTGSRIGGTFAMPVTRHQSFKLSYSDGTYIRVGGNYQSVSVAWQYSWLGKP